MTSRAIHFISLGCPKNRVDTEVMVGVARRAGHEHVEDPAEADVVVVNTCGFIDSAKRESIQTILDAAALKDSGACRKLIVTGCLSQRHPEELAVELPEVDHFLGSSDMLRLGDLLDDRVEAERVMVGNPAEWIVGADDPRVVSTRGASAYVKIAEGCNRSCSFCVIPSLRGKQRSRDPDDVVREVQRLADAGVLEVNLVSEDTVAYGRDLPARPPLADLVRRVAEVQGIRWVRLFYLYPERIDDALVELLAEHPRVVPYVDMPLQHAADGMLRRMRRGHGGQRLRDLVERLREAIDDLVLRSAFIVGHPGETEAEFRELLDFVRWAEIDRVGVFRYSDEESARSHQLDDKVASDSAAARADELMSVQRPISRRKNEALVGRELEVLVEGPSDEHDWVLGGRHAGQAPDIDGSVYLSGAHAPPGTMVRARVSQASDYDLVAEVDDDAPGEAAAIPDPAPIVHRASDGRRVTLRTV